MNIIVIMFWLIVALTTNLLAQGGTHVQEITIAKDLVDRKYYLGPRDILEITVIGLKEFERKGLGDEPRVCDK